MRRDVLLFAPILVALIGCPSARVPSPEPIPDPSPDPNDFDCASLPDTLDSERTLEGARGYKGLTFDAAGLIVGSDTSSLIEASPDGDWGVFLPGIGEVEGMATLPDGDLVVTTSWDDGALRRLTPEGGVHTLVGGLGAYSVQVGPDGALWAAGWEGAWRVDPLTGDIQTLLETDWDAPWSARTLAFSRSLKRLYVGTVDDQGRIFYLDLDDDLQPTGEPQVFVSGVGNGWHDGLGMDVCGNLWAVDYESASLYRVSPEGEIDRMFDWSDDREQFGHGLVWAPEGSDWRTDALYLPVPEAGSVVKEVVIGVPGFVPGG